VEVNQTKHYLVADKTPSKQNQKYVVDSSRLPSSSKGIVFKKIVGHTFIFQNDLEEIRLIVESYDSKKRELSIRNSRFPDRLFEVKTGRGIQFSKRNIFWALPTRMQLRVGNKIGDIIISEINDCEDQGNTERVITITCSAHDDPHKYPTNEENITNDLLRLGAKGVSLCKVCRKKTNKTGVSPVAGYTDLASSDDPADKLIIEKLVDSTDAENVGPKSFNNAVFKCLFPGCTVTKEMSFNRARTTRVCRKHEGRRFLSEAYLIALFEHLNIKYLMEQTQYGISGGELYQMHGLRADFVLEELKVIAEAEGSVHNKDSEEKKEKRKRLAKEASGNGWTLIEVKLEGEMADYKEGVIDSGLLRATGYLETDVDWDLVAQMALNMTYQQIWKEFDRVYQLTDSQEEALQHLVSNPIFGNYQYDWYRTILARGAEIGANLYQRNKSRNWSVTVVHEGIETIFDSLKAACNYLPDWIFGDMHEVSKHRILREIGQREGGSDEHEIRGSGYFIYLERKKAKR
jgi:very-short-patch-repair endonuclease